MGFFDFFRRVISSFRGEALVYRDSDPEAFSDYEARKMRYELYTALANNTQYNDIHKWARGYKLENGLYRYIRGIYNPARRISDFWASHLMGGLLDREAGPEGALPIVTDNQILRPAIAKLWLWSQWQAKKEVFTRRGAVLGDTAIKIIDDPLRKKVHLQVIHPARIFDLVKDPYGNVKAYTLLHPFVDEKGMDSFIVERAFKKDDTVVFELQTERGALISRKVTNYGFVPFVHRPHIDVGSDEINNANWGLSEYHASLPKIQEADDLASKLHDQIRKTVEAPWLLLGVTEPKDGGPATPTQSKSSRDRPQPGREEVPTFYGPEGGGAIPLVAPLPIEETLNVILSMVDELKRDHPELQADELSEKQETSGKALRVVRQRLENKVIGHRPIYDNALVIAQQMAIAIAGEGNYSPEFSSFGLDSFERGDLDHHIGTRDVFRPDEADQTAITKTYWEAAELATKSGVDVPTFMTLEGSDPTDISLVRRAQSRSAAKQAAQPQEQVGQVVEEEVADEELSIE